MSNEYDNTDKGALFKNDKKESDKHPDYRGSINVGGTEYWLSAWLKTSKAWQKYFSLSVKPKEERPAHKVNGPASSDPDLNDDIPF